MVNHPNRSQKSLDAAIRRLILKHSLQRIEFGVTREAVFARAMPDSFNPMVTKRREAAFADAESMTLAQATKITEASMGAVATGHGATLEEAVDALKAALSV